MIYGIVSEFNPFHDGHKYLIDKIKTENDTVITVMSGNFVQRGDFAVMSKWNRAKAALDNGVDLVIELPTPIATMSAEGFAENSVLLLNDLGIVNKIAFGAENDNIQELKKIAEELCGNNFNEQISIKMKEKNISFPTARKEIINNDIIDTPNNILAIEYIKAIIKNNLDIEPVSIKRIGSAHDEIGENKIPSASQIRNEMNKNNFSKICSSKRCERAILAKLRSMTIEDFAKIQDVNEGLEYKIFDSVKKAVSLDELYNLIKSKRYTMSRIRRIILRAFLGITNDDMKKSPYVRVLGFNEKGRQALKIMKETAKIPVILNYSQVKKLNEDCQSLFNKECLWTDLYNLGFEEIKICGEEMTANIIRKI